MILLEEHPIRPVPCPEPLRPAGLAFDSSTLWPRGEGLKPLPIRRIGAVLARQTQRGLELLLFPVHGGRPWVVDAASIVCDPALQQVPESPPAPLLIHLVTESSPGVVTDRSTLMLSAGGPPKLGDFGDSAGRVVAILAAAASPAPPVSASPVSAPPAEVSPSLPEATPSPPESTPASAASARGSKPAEPVTFPPVQGALSIFGLSVVALLVFGTLGLLQIEPGRKEAGVLLPGLHGLLTFDLVCWVAAWGAGIFGFSGIVRKSKDVAVFWRSSATYLGLFAVLESALFLRLKILASSLPAELDAFESGLLTRNLVILGLAVCWWLYWRSWEDRFRAELRAELLVIRRPTLTAEPVRRSEDQERISRSTVRAPASRAPSR